MPLNRKKNKVVYLHSLFIFEEYGGKLKAADLINAAVKICREKIGAEVFLCICSNPFTCRACVSLGWELVAEIKYKNSDFPLALMSDEFLKSFDRVWVVVKRLPRAVNSKL